MAPRPSKEIETFREKYGIASDEIWCVHNTTWVVKHKALERVAAEVGITWDRPAPLEMNSKEGIVSMCVFGKLGERTEWSIGEASPKNNKNSYPWAMAEKRAKDRVILKLLNTHGELYSEDEADDFKQPAKRENPHVTRPEDIVPPPAENILTGDPSVKPMPKAASRDLFSELQAEIWACAAPEALRMWAIKRKAEVAKLPDDWRETLRGIYAEHLEAVQPRDAAE